MAVQYTEICAFPDACHIVSGQTFSFQQLLRASVVGHKGIHMSQTFAYQVFVDPGTVSQLNMGKRASVFIFFITIELQSNCFPGDQRFKSAFCFIAIGLSSLPVMCNFGAVDSQQTYFFTRNGSKGIAVKNSVYGHPARLTYNRERT